MASPLLTAGHPEPQSLCGNRRDFTHRYKAPEPNDEVLALAWRSVTMATTPSSAWAHAAGRMRPGRTKL